MALGGAAPMDIGGDGSYDGFSAELEGEGIGVVWAKKFIIAHIINSRAGVLILLTP